jgi:hypothetical protein
MLISMVVMAACTSGPSTGEAVEAWAGMDNANWWGLIGATAQARDAGAPADVIALNFNGACPDGGTVSVTGIYDNSAIATSTSFDLKTSLVRCANDQGTFDGDFTWTSRVFTTGVSTTVKGDLTYQTAHEVFACNVDEWSTTDSTLHFAGTICGYDMRDDLKLGY